MRKQTRRQRSLEARCREQASDIGRLKRNGAHAHVQSQASRDGGGGGASGQDRLLMGASRVMEGRREQALSPAATPRSTTAPEGRRTEEGVSGSGERMELLQQRVRRLEKDKTRLMETVVAHKRVEVELLAEVRGMASPCTQRSTWKVLLLLV